MNVMLYVEGRIFWDAVNDEFTVVGSIVGVVRGADAMKSNLKRNVIVIELILIVLMIINCILTEMVIVKVCTCVVIVGSIISFVCLLLDKKNRKK